MEAELWIPVITTAVAGIFAAISAKISHDNKPVRDIIKRTNLEGGDGSLADAMGTLSKEYQESQARYKREIIFLNEQRAGDRAEIEKLHRELNAKDTEILILEKRVAQLEARMDLNKELDRERT